MFETDSVPRAWLPRLLEVDEVWVPCEFNLETFRRGGMPADRVHVLPETIDFDLFDRDQTEPLAVHGTRGFTFLTNFDFTDRKGWDVLLDAWYDAFSPDDDVCLVLKCLGLHVPESEIRGRIDAYLAGRSTAPILLDTRFLPTADMPRLYAGADAFVLASRGEGERVAPGVEQHVPALAVGEVEIREEGEAARASAPIAARSPRRSKRSKSIVSGSTLQPVLRHPAALEGLEVELARHPHLVDLEQARQPRPRHTVGLEHRAGDVRPLRVQRLARPGDAMVDEDEITLRRAGKRPFDSLLMRPGEPNPVVREPDVARRSRMPGSVKRDQVGPSLVGVSERVEQRPRPDERQGLPAHAARRPQRRSASSRRLATRPSSKWSSPTNEPSRFRRV